MIVRITGKLVQVERERAVVERDGLWREVLVPTYVNDQLLALKGREIDLYTIEYYEGSAAGGNLYPRLVGFLDTHDRAFFMEFIKVKGVGIKKALRAFAKPAAWIAEQIEQGDTKMLATLPELGKRTAEHLVASLRGKLDQFAPAQTIQAEESLSQAQRESLEILLQLGERRAEAISYIEEVTAKSDIGDSAAIVEAVYKLKAGTL